MNNENKEGETDKFGGHTGGQGEIYSFEARANDLLVNC